VKVRGPTALNLLPAVVRNILQQYAVTLVDGTPLHIQKFGK